MKEIIFHICDIIDVSAVFYMRLLIPVKYYYVCCHFLLFLVYVQFVLSVHFMFRAGVQTRNAHTWYEIYDILLPIFMVSISL